MPKQPRPKAFVLRSGYVVPFDGDDCAMMEELTQAIIDQSLAAGRKKRNKTKEVFEKEVFAECDHLASTMPEGLAHALLTDHLAALVFALVRKQVMEYDASLTTDTIQ